MRWSHLEHRQHKLFHTKVLPVHRCILPAYLPQLTQGEEAAVVEVLTETGSAELHKGGEGDRERERGEREREERER